MITGGEREILVRLAHGDTLTQAAGAVGVGQVRTRRLLRSAKRKLGARTTPHAVTLAWRRRLIGPGDLPPRHHDIAALLLDYLRRCRSGEIPAPEESWPELRARCAAIGARVRGARTGPVEYGAADLLTLLGAMIET